MQSGKSISVIMLFITLMTAFPFIPNLSAAGTYQEYNDQVFEKSKDLKRVLFFFAPWCAGCRMTDQQLTSADIPDGVMIFKIDYDSSVDLRKKYDVPYQGTYVQIDENGEKVALWHGYADTLSKNIQ